MQALPPHPDYSEQVQASNAYCQNISVKAVSQYLESRFSLTLNHLTRMRTSGVINFLYLIEATDSKGQPLKFVLRVSNAHRMWKHMKTQHQATLLKHLKAHTFVPVPQVVDYSSDSESSCLRCEFILMKYVPHRCDLGQHRDDLLAKFKEYQASQDKQGITQLLIQTKQLLDQAFQIIKQLTSVRYNSQWICGFGSTMDQPGHISCDGALAPPFHTYRQFLVYYLDANISYLKREHSLSDLRQKALEGLKKVLEEVKSTPSAVLDGQKKYHLVHRDLHAGNFVVDQKNTIVGLFDWEHSRNGWLQEESDETNLVKHWFSGLKDTHMYGELAKYQDELRKKYNLEVCEHWNTYRKYSDINSMAGWCWFYVANWWADIHDVTPETLWLSQQQKNLTQLVDALQGYGYV